MSRNGRVGAKTAQTRDWSNKKDASQSRLEVGVQFNPSRMRLTEVITDVQKATAKSIVQDEHAYRPVQASLSRRVDFLVMGGETVGGVVGFSDQQTLMLPYSKRRWLGLTTMDELKEAIIYCVDNYRFTMMERGHGSRVLAMAAKVLPKVWLRKYETPIACLTTAVKPPWEGTVYKAAGWDLIGYTTGNKDFRYHARDGELYKPIYDGQRLILFGKWIKGWGQVRLRRMISELTAVNVAGSDKLGNDDDAGEVVDWRKTLKVSLSSPRTRR